ncbi:MAG: hypothetical protein AB8I08_14295 [Sandaracinaceae bacterium]
MHASVRPGPRRGGLASAAFALTCLLTLGCEDPGIMELELRLPPAPESFDLGECVEGACDAADTTCEAGRCIYRGRWDSELEITSFDFVTEAGPLQWTNAGVGAIPLATGAEDPRWNCTSVQGDPSVETVRVRLRYCRDGCDPLEPSIEHWFEIERPFYNGRRTHVRRRAPNIQPSLDSCIEDTECATSEAGPVCVSSTARCGCTDDAQCAAGHCEGLEFFPEGRCTVDIERCRVLGCISVGMLRPVEAGEICLGGATASEGNHPCEESPTFDYMPPDGAGCFLP